MIFLLPLIFLVGSIKSYPVRGVRAAPWISGERRSLQFQLQETTHEGFSIPAPGPGKGISPRFPVLIETMSYLFCCYLACARQYRIEEDCEGDGQQYA